MFNHSRFVFGLGLGAWVPVPVIVDTVSAVHLDKLIGTPASVLSDYFSLFRYSEYRNVASAGFSYYVGDPQLSTYFPFHASVMTG